MCLTLDYTNIFQCSKNVDCDIFAQRYKLEGQVTQFGGRMLAQHY